MSAAASSHLPGTASERPASPGNSSSSQHVQPTAHNASSSAGEGCLRVAFGEMEFLPWDNPDSVVSQEVEAVVRGIKNNLVVLLFLIGGPANVVNMAVFCKQGLGDRVNLCLFALSLADELFLTTSLLLHGEQLYLQFTTKDNYGPVMTFLTNNNLSFFLASTFISPTLSTIVATERCLCVLSPLRFQTLLRTRTMAAIILVVYVATTASFSIVLFRYRIGCVYDATSGTVMSAMVEGPFYKAHRTVIDLLHSFVFGTGLPVLETLVVAATTMITIVKLRQAARWRRGSGSGSGSAGSPVVIPPAEVALTKILVGNSLFFMACVTPVTLIRCSWLVLPGLRSGGRHHNLFLVGVWLNEMFTLVNCSFNFFVYYAMGSRYRDTLWALLGRKRVGVHKM